MTNTCKYCGGLIDQSASFCDSRCKDLFSKYTPICKQCAAKDADIERLKGLIEDANKLLDRAYGFNNEDMGWDVDFEDLKEKTKTI